MSVVLTLRYHDSEPGGGICADEAEAKAEAAKVAREVLENYNPSAEELDEKIRVFLIEADEENTDARLDQVARLGVDDLTDDEALDLCGDDMQFEWSTLPGAPETTAEQALTGIVGVYGDAPVSAAALLETGVYLARLIVARWTSGDLAGAVNGLEEWAEEVQTAFPGLDYTDDEDTDADAAEG